MFFLSTTTASPAPATDFSLCVKYKSQDKSFPSRFAVVIKGESKEEKCLKEFYKVILKNGENPDISLVLPEVDSLRISTYTGTEQDPFKTRLERLKDVNPLMNEGCEITFNKLNGKPSATIKLLGWIEISKES